MSTTSNYGFDKKVEVTLCATDGIDRELARIEKKIDCCKDSSALKCHVTDPCAHKALFEGKVDKKEGCRLICEEELKAVAAALEARYTKDETYPRERLYTQKEVDALLAEKADLTPPVEYDFDFAEGVINFEGNYKNYRSRYYKNAFGEVTVSIYAKAEEGSFTSPKVLGTLPEGFRPESVVGACGMTVGTGLIAGSANIDEFGRVQMYCSKDFTGVTNFNCTFLAKN